MSSRKHNTQAEPDVRESPKVLYNELNEEFSFTLDAAATHQNALCSTYFTEQGLFFVRPWETTTGYIKKSDDNGLTGRWFGRVFLNPPYSNVGDWVIKASMEAALGDVELIVMLIPANRTEQAWWHDYIEPHRDTPHGSLKTRFIRGRKHFTINGGQPILNKTTGKRSSPDFPVMLLIWDNRK